MTNWPSCRCCNRQIGGKTAANPDPHDPTEGYTLITVYRSHTDADTVWYCRPCWIDMAERLKAAASWAKNAKETA